jgi:hypothetical protein
VRGIRAFALWLVGSVVLVSAVIMVARGVLNKVGEELDGTAPARRETEFAAEELNDDLGHRSRSRSAEHIAATEIPAEMSGTTHDGPFRLTPVAWSGRVFSDEQATIDVRFEVPSLDPAVRPAACYRYTLQMYRYTTFKAADCPKGAAPPSPSPSPPPALPPDAGERLAGVLKSATPETLEGAVRAAFPDDFSVDTVTEDGVLVAAVGVPAERDCVVVIRTPDGRTKSIGFDRIWLEPGEMGCGTGLYTHPPR